MAVFKILSLFDGNNPRLSFYVYISIKKCNAKLVAIYSHFRSNTFHYYGPFILFIPL